MKSNVLAYDFRHTDQIFGAALLSLTASGIEATEIAFHPWTGAGLWNWNEIPSLGHSSAAAWIIIGR